MHGRVSARTAAAVLLLVSCTSKRDIGNVPAGGGGNGGAAGTGPGTGGQGVGGAGVGGGAAGTTETGGTGGQGMGGQGTGGQGTGGSTDAGASDATHDAGPVMCDVTRPFGAPTPVTELNGSASQISATLTADELAVYFASNRQAPGTVDFDVYFATRTSTAAPFGAVTRVAEVSAVGVDDRGPMIAPDGLRLYFHSTRSGEFKIWNAARADRQSAFGSPAMVAGVNQSGAIDGNPWILANGQALYFSSDRVHDAAGNSNIYRSALGPSGFQTPAIVAELGHGAAPVVTDDELVIYFAAPPANPDAGSDNDIWMARRAAVSDSFGPPVAVAELSTHPAWEFASWLSRDRCRIYFMRDYQIYMAERSP